MARSFTHSVLINGKPVGFSLKRRVGEPGQYVCFRGPDGRRLERATMQTGRAKALEAARFIIVQEHNSAETPAGEVTWEETERRFLRRMKLTGLRQNTLDYYAKMLGLVKTAFGAAHGPADITSDMAKAFVDKILAGHFHKSKKPRSAAYVFNALRGLDSLWEKWLIKECGIVAGNPWRAVPRPKLDKPHVVALTDEQMAAFFLYLEEQWLGWKLPNLFFTVKAMTGCRLEDICSLGSDQLQGGRLIFRADQTKGRKERRVPLPAELFADLEAIRGKTYLWDRFPGELRHTLQARGIGSWKLVSQTYSPPMLYNWVTQLLRRYSKKVGRRVTSHMFRKRAFTLAFLAGLDARKAAIAIGCNVDTMMKHYVSLDEQAVTDEVFAELQGRLLPKK